ncbi:MAG: galactose mutarotase [Bacteroidetes bacterium]|nr:galactose mutarotase [Bacteroidota bacterium]MBU1115230.1 galactose mutarotase [Bacteroidota bacterium]MBU1797248.1 galactose mutarotase [Bacteroidota bacterium]
MISKKLFGKLTNGSKVNLFTLTNKSGTEATITEYGATLVSLFVADKNGKFEDVVLGYDSLDGYVKGASYFGAIVGRYGNRIGKGKFNLDGKEYQLTINDGENHLHGGALGFNKVLWKGEEIESSEGASVKFSYLSVDGEEGYPGTINITVIYTLTNNNELKIDYSATTDETTILNPTHHSYFNLTGNLENTILNHELKINAEYYTPVDSSLITTGELAKVENTPMDFSVTKKIGEKIDSDFEQLVYGKGYDHNWVLNNFDGNVNNVASLYEPTSGRLMEVLTDQPGIQFYSGNFLDGTTVGKNNIVYNHRVGLCLETQCFPDSPNKLNFPSVKLTKGDTYKQQTIYRFSIK